MNNRRWFARTLGQLKERITDYFEIFFKKTELYNAYFGKDVGIGEVNVRGGLRSRWRASYHRGTYFIRGRNHIALTRNCRHRNALF